MKYLVLANRKIWHFIQAGWKKLLAYNNAAFTNVFFTLVFSLILLVTVLSHSLGWMLGLGLVILFIWKLSKGLAWHNLFFLLIILGLSAFLNIWSNWFFTALSIILMMALFYWQMLKPDKEEVSNFAKDAFFYILYLYFVLSLYTAFFVLHLSYPLVFLTYIVLASAITYLRLLQVKLALSRLEFLVFILIMAELFWIVALMPLNYLNQALMSLLWYYFALEILKNRRLGDFFKKKIVYQFVILIAVTIALSL